LRSAYWPCWGRAPPSLKIFLLALAIIDDLGAIIIIVVFYTAELSLVALALAGLGVAALVALNLAGVARRAAYMLIGVGIWICFLKSGIHDTLAGVIVGVAMPLNASDGSSPAHDLEHALHPWVAFGVLPAFAFANAGLSLTDIALNDLQATRGDRIDLGSHPHRPRDAPRGDRLAPHLRNRLHNELVHGHARLPGRGL
jgi:Na+/H+ antiporter NhaA